MQFVVVCALIAVGQAAYSVAPGYPIGNTGLATAAVTSQQSNILRSYGNLGQVSTYSKTIDTPYSSVSKSDVRVSNPGYATVAHGPIGYNPYVAHAAAPLLARPAYAAPYAAPYAAHAYGHPYGAPVVAKGRSLYDLFIFNRRRRRRLTNKSN